MKKLFVFVGILFLAACGNSGASSNLEDFDNSNLKEDLQEETFQSELPTQTPFEVEGATFTPPPGDQREINSIVSISRCGWSVYGSAN